MPFIILLCFIIYSFCGKYNKMESLCETAIFHMRICATKNPDASSTSGSYKLGYKDSNLEMTESESVALPFGDSPSTINDYSGKRAV